MSETRWDREEYLWATSHPHRWRRETWVSGAEEPTIDLIEGPMADDALLVVLPDPPPDRRADDAVGPSFARFREGDLTVMLDAGLDDRQRHGEVRLGDARLTYYERDDHTRDFYFNGWPAVTLPDDLSARDLLDLWDLCVRLDTTILLASLFDGFRDLDA